MASPRDQAPPPGGGFRVPVAIAALVVATLAVYAPVRGFGFVNFDDPSYVAANPHLWRGIDRQSLVWAFTTGRTANWMPITWLSLLLDVELFGVSPAAHHVVNVLLHVANALLVFVLLLRLGGRTGWSFAVAAVFALHPLRVESVAWIAERKDVLCATFALLAVHAWLGWVRHGGGWRYLLASLLFALGLMAKPMIVTLPFVLLLLDYWPLRRTRFSPGRSASDAGTRSLARLLLEKSPLFALAAASSAITVLVQHAGGAVADRIVLPAGERVAGALAAYGWYVSKTLWPTGLAALYPNPVLVGGAIPTLDVVVGAAVLAVVSLVALREARRRPWLLVGWAIFVGMLVPVIGLVQVGQQATADRYSYLPSLGLAVVLLGALRELAARLRVPRAAQAAVVVVLLAGLAIATRVQLEHWRDSVALARRAIAVTRDNHVMHFNLALALDERGDLPGALAHYAEAVRIRPDRAGARVNHAAALARAGRVDEAAAEYRIAIALDPHDVAAANNLGWLRATHPDGARRDAAEALALAREVVRRQPDDPDALDLLAAAQAEAGRFADAARTADAALDAARSAGRSDLLQPIARRRALYASGRAYREAPTVAPTAAPPAGDAPERQPALP